MAWSIALMAASCSSSSDRRSMISRHFNSAKFWTSWAASSLAIVGLLVLTGCGRDASSDTGTDRNLALLTKIYADHMNSHQGSPPKNEGAFREFIRAHGAHRLDQAGVDNAEQLFISTRDHQPLVFVYGPHPDPRRQSMVIGYEQSAVEGKRTVGYRHGTAELVEETRFRELVPLPATGK